jgi:DNA processing protein
MNEKEDHMSRLSARGAERPIGRTEKRAWLRLVRTPQIGSVTFWALLSHFGSADAALSALPEFASHGARFSARSIPSEASIEEEIEKAHSCGISLVSLRERGYPPLLARADLPPPLLYIKGNPDIWDRPPLAIVGSRNASAAGLKFASEISSILASRGFLIVSGLARGIDAAAHRGALPDSTCAILPGGLDVIYPPEHASLAAGIAERGLIASECPPGFTARSQDFPRRNRIISGCSLGVVIVEAADRSGSLITARLAAEQNREVFAVPGHPFEPRAAGTNRLIKEGAILTTGPDDIEQALQYCLAEWQGKAPQLDLSLRVQDQPQAASAFPETEGAPENFDIIGDAAKDILKLLSYSPIDIDELCRLSGMEARHLNAALLTLDLSGHIERRGLRQVSLRP